MGLCLVSFPEFTWADLEWSVSSDAAYTIFEVSIILAEIRPTCLKFLSQNWILITVYQLLRVMTGLFQNG